MAGLIGLDSTGSGFDPGLQDPPITFGVWGDSGEADGVIGSSNTGVGVFGRSVGAGAPAVRAASENGTGVQATSASGTALHARRDPGGGATVTEAFLATPSLAADFRGDVAATGALRVGGRLGIGAAEPRRSLHVEGSEVHSGGPGGGFSFADRAGTSLVEDPQNGERWRWYAEGGSARLWSGTDRLTIDKTGNIGIGTTKPNAVLEVSTPSATGVQEGIRINTPVGFVGNGHGSSLVFAQRADTIMAAIQCVQDVANSSERAYLAFRTRSGIGPANDVSEKLRISADANISIVTIFGDCQVTGRIHKSATSFKIDHPLDPENKFLYHSSIECDEMKNLYDGVAELDTDGRAEVVLPDWFEALNETFRYQLTPIGAAAPDLHIADELRDGRFTIGGGQPNMKVCWLVSGVRHDAYAQAHPLRVEVPKSSEEAGLFLHAEEHDQPAERSMDTLFTAPANGAGHG